MILYVTFTFESPTYEVHKEINSFSYGYVGLYYNGWDPIEHTLRLIFPGILRELSNDFVSVFSKQLF